MKTIVTETTPLNAHGVDTVSQKIRESLTAYPFLKRRDILRIQLSAEEFMLHWMAEVKDAEIQLSIEQKGRWLNISLVLIGPGYRCDPLSGESALGGGLADSLLATLGIGWIFQFDHGQNSVYISVEAEKSRRVQHVFLAMALVLATGIVFLGTVLGVAMLFLQRQVRTAERLVQEGNALICRILVGFEKVLPLFVYLSMADTALTTDVSGLITYVKVTLLLAAFLAAVTASQFVLVVLRLKIPVAKLWTILKPSFMVQLASASSSVAFAESYEACERGFGIDRKLVRFALPIGTVMHKPLIAAEFIFIIAAARGADGVGLNTGSLLILMLMAFLLSVAYPPVSGGEINCYTMLLLQMGMDAGLLAVACTLSSVFDTLEAPGNTICTELQLLLTAHKHGMAEKMTDAA